MTLTYSLYDAHGKRLYLTMEERQAFYDAAMKQAPKVRTLCLLLYYTGCRISEALNLTAERVDLSAGEIVIHSLKKRSATPHYRAVPIPSDYLNDLVAVHTRGGENEKLWDWSRTQGWRHIKATMQQAGINMTKPYATCKGLRHSFGIHAVSCNVPLNIVQALLGHANMSTTAIYVGAVGDERRALVARMWSTY